MTNLFLILTSLFYLLTSWRSLRIGFLNKPKRRYNVLKNQVICGEVVLTLGQSVRLGVYHLIWGGGGGESERRMRSSNLSSLCLCLALYISLYLSPSLYLTLYLYLSSSPFLFSFNIFNFSFSQLKNFRTCFTSLQYLMVNQFIRQTKYIFKIYKTSR